MHLKYIWNDPLDVLFGIDWFKWHRNDTPKTLQPNYQFLAPWLIQRRFVRGIFQFLICFVYFILISIIWQSLKLPGRRQTSKIFPVRSTWSTCFFFASHLGMARRNIIPPRPDGSGNPMPSGDESKGSWRGGLLLEFCWIGTFLDKELIRWFIWKGTVNMSIDPENKNLKQYSFQDLYH